MTRFIFSQLYHVQHPSDRGRPQRHLQRPPRPQAAGPDLPVHGAHGGAGRDRSAEKRGQDKERSQGKLSKFVAIMKTV